MPYRISIATPEDRDLVVAALRGAGEQRTRVARQAAGKVAATKAEGRDVRSSAVKVVALLAEADTLESLAAELEAAPEVAIVSAAAGTLAIPEPDVAIDPPAGDGTGLSAEAQVAAARAELKDFDPDVPEDPLTGATPEDEPTDDDLEEVLKP